MIICERNNVALEGSALTLLAEFGVIAHSLREALLHEFDDKIDAESLREMMDTAYNFRGEGETC